jgi:hypothetical protein
LGGSITNKRLISSIAIETFTAKRVVQHRSQCVLIWVYPIASFLSIPTNIRIELESFTMKDWELSNVSFLSMATNSRYSINITMRINLIMILIIKSHWLKVPLYKLPLQIFMGHAQMTIILVFPRAIFLSMVTNITVGWTNLTLKKILAHENHRNIQQ